LAVVSAGAEAVVSTGAGVGVVVSVVTESLFSPSSLCSAELQAANAKTVHTAMIEKYFFI